MKKYGITCNKLYQIVGDFRRNKNDKRIENSLKDENLQKAIEEYKNTRNSIRSICEKYNISSSRLMKHVKDYRRGSANKGRKYSLNEEKMIIDSREKFYWLGFISADGYVSEKGVLAIELKSIDKPHLQKFADFLETDKPIVDRINNQNVECSKIVIHSVNIVNYISQYNIIPCKSLVFTIPVEKIPEIYIYDYIRGLMDGDGCIRINNHQQISFNFCSGNKKCCEQLKEILGIDNKISEDKHSKTWRFQTTGNIKAKRILDKIYENSTKNTRLDRKYNIYKTIN